MILVPELVRTVLQVLQLPLPFASPPTSAEPPAQQQASFQLQRHFTQHPADDQALLLHPSSGLAAQLAPADPLVIRTRRVKVQRPRSQAAFEAARVAGRAAGFTGSVEWEDDEVDGPDIEDRETLLSLAKMTSDAYILPDETGWYPIDGYNNTIPVGWEPNADRLRGHIFANDDNSTVILSLKGTSAGLLGSGGPTAKNDRVQDNLLLCCCARVDFSWSTVCDCFSGANTCGQTCVEKALIEESVYYPIATHLYNNLTHLYPHAQIWLTGHSLGGALASLLGVTFGAPTVAFESPGDRLAARRLHLPLPPGMGGETVTHVYHTADPIPNGACTGKLSSCYAAGFALEARCHLGQTVLYDTVNELGWSVDVRTHSIVQVIDRLLSSDWDDGDGPEKGDPPPTTEPGNNRTLPSSSSSLSSSSSASSSKTRGKGAAEPSATGGAGKGGKKKGRAVPKAEPETDCVDCFKWEFKDPDE